MRSRQLASAGAMSLAPLLLVAACPALSEIGVGTPADAGIDHTFVRPRPEGGADVRRAIDARPEAAVTDAGGVDAPCDANVRSDPGNCGRCRHDCLGGACLGGVCEAVVIYHGDNPNGILVDGPTLIVTVAGVLPETGYVFRCMAADCQITKTVLASGLANPWFPAKEGASVYWADFGAADAAAALGGVLGCPEEGCPDAGPVIYMPEAGGPESGTQFTGLAVDPTYLYWGSYTNLSASVSRCVPTECAATRAELGSGFGVPYSVAVDKSAVFWIDLSTNQVLRCALPSCGDNPQIISDLTVAGIQVGLSGLALYGGDVYWTEGLGDGGLYRCAKSGCGGAPMALVKDQPNPSFLAVDDSGVYWVNSGDNTICTCPLAGCAKPVVLAKAQAAFALALDDVSVYFTSTSVVGAVLRVAK